MAITAVVLGGTSIFGGRGTVLGTVLGLFAIVILQNGLRLSAQPADLAGILTGVLLVGTILVDRLSARVRSARLTGPNLEQISSRQSTIGNRQSLEEVEVRNSQLAILSVVILVSAVIVAGTNWMSLRSLREDLKNPAGRQNAATEPAHNPLIPLLPKPKVDPHFFTSHHDATKPPHKLHLN